jgi:hypothetical protein
MTAALSEEERFILEAIKQHGENGTNIGYKALQEVCADEFEGVRLILKKLKDKGLVQFDGMIPGFSAIISLP